MSSFLNFLQSGQQTSSSSKKSYATDNVSVIKPKSFSEVQLLLDSLKQNEGFIVDFEETEPKLAQRMLDFLSGAIYSLDGRIEQIKDKMYILLPKGLNIKTRLIKGKK